MLSPEEKRLIAAILALLLFGAMIEAYRSRVVARETEKTVLPGLTSGEKASTRQ